MVFTVDVDVPRGSQAGLCLLPLVSICWEDEMLSPRELGALPNEDRDTILKAFRIRRQICDSQALSVEDQEFWDVLRSLVPQWALFSPIET